MEQTKRQAKQSRKEGNKRKPQINPKGKSAKTEKKQRFRQEMYKSKMGNKSEGYGFASQQKTLMQHKYKKLLRKEQSILESQSKKVRDIYSEMGSSDTLPSPEDRQTSVRPKQRPRQEKPSRFLKAEMAFKQKAKEQERKSKEMQNQREEREKALDEYVKKKKKQHKKLVKKNFRGQPVMASQMELLLQKLESQKS